MAEVCTRSEQGGRARGGRQHLLLWGLVVVLDGDSAGAPSTLSEDAGLDIEPHMIDADRVAAAILASPYERVVVTIDEDDQIRVIPYDRNER